MKGVNGKRAKRGERESGLEETFTVNRLKLAPSLMRCLASTNAIKNPNGAVRRAHHRVSRWRDAELARCWAATEFLEAGKSFRKIQRHRRLWVLDSARSFGNIVQLRSEHAALSQSVEEVDLSARAA